MFGGMSSMADKETGHENEMSFESALENYLNPDFGDLEEGSITKGEIVRVDDDNVLVDVNFKSEGQIPASEFRDAAGNMTVSVGDRVDVYVVRKNEMEGTITLSFEKAKRMQVFDQLEDVQENNRVIKGHIVRRIKGGYTVDIGGVEAFLPGSHVDLRPVPDMDALVNQEFEFRVLKINRRRSKVIVSRRVLLEEERDSKRQDLLRTLEEGQIVHGKAKNITEYGVFVDLGGLDGLLHITDMSWKRIRHPREMVTLGQDLELKVLSFDKDNQKVSLGLKQLVPDPWQDISARFPEGAKCTGKVTNLVDYGAFVELEPGVEGLVHISEMSWTRKLRHPSQMVHTGDEVEVVILGVDGEKKRISLGMKQVRPNPWELVAEKYPEGTILEGVIKNITEFGMFIGIEDGIDGLIHVSDISWTKKVRHPNEIYKVGDTVQAKVLTVDQENEKFTLGIKQLVDEGSCIIVGKCADYVLKDYDNVVSVYIEAPRRYTVKRIMERMDVDEKEANKRITMTDKYRADYYKYYTGGNYWTNPVNYDITLNSEKLGIQGCIDMIKFCLKTKLGIEIEI